MMTSHKKTENNSDVQLLQLSGLLLVFVCSLVSLDRCCFTFCVELQFFTCRNCSSIRSNSDRLNESHAGIKIAGRNINNLRYAYNTTLVQKMKRN